EDAKPATPVGSDPGRQPPRRGDPSDRPDQLGPGVGHEPSIQSPPGYRSRSPVQHDALAAVLHQQTGRGVTGGGHGPDAEERDLYDGGFPVPLTHRGRAAARWSSAPLWPRRPAWKSRTATPAFRKTASATPPERHAADAAATARGHRDQVGPVGV